MAKEYLAKLTELVDETTSGLFDGVHLECKHFFSGAALYAEERICLSWTPVGLAFKLPPERLDKLLKDGEAEPLQYFANGPIKKGYVLFPEGHGNNRSAGKKHVNDSITYALTLPKPIKKKKR